MVNDDALHHHLYYNISVKIKLDISNCYEEFFYFPFNLGKNTNSEKIPPTFRILKRCLGKVSLKVLKH